MIKIINGQVESFHFILATRMLEHLGEINNIDEDSFSATINMNSANEITFNVYKEMEGYIEPLWDQIFDLRLVYVKELDEYFEINISEKDVTYNIKTITATSLCANELSQTYLYDIEINTANDLEYSNYKPTIFYNESNPKCSLLHRVLEKMPAYSIGHVDDSLQRLQRTFSISNSSIYDFLTGECANELECMFKFYIDSKTKERKIDVYDLLTVCRNDECNYYKTSINKIRYRGRYNDFCPKCNSSNISYYGEDTTVFVSTENLTEEIEYVNDVKSMKNCFRLTAGDEDMTAAVMNVNPNGSRYIYNFSKETLKDMPKELVEQLEIYNNLFNDYLYTKELYLNEDMVNAYNNLLQKDLNGSGDTYNKRYARFYKENGDIESRELKLITKPIIGHNNLVLYMYEVNDMYSFLKHTMMPYREQVKITAETEKAKLEKAYDDGDFTTLSLSKLTKSTSFTTINSALVNYAKVWVKTGYVKVEAIMESGEISYDQENKIGTGKWVGKFKITDYSDTTVFVETKTMTITIDDKYDTFMKQKVLKNISVNDDDENTVFNILKIKDLNSFKNALKQYCSVRLESFRDAIQAALTILADAQQGNEGNTLYQDFYLPYYDKLVACENELAKRNEELDVIAVYQKIIDENKNESEILNAGIYKEILDMVEVIQKELNLQNFLNNQGLYKIFTTYRREDEYENANYISTGYTNSQLISKALEFYETAQKELVKSSTYQHSINSNLYNLLALKEFEPIVDKFQLGNWIRIKVDDTVYRLRLIKYEISFGDLTKLNTEFSDVTITADGMNDIQSLLSKVTSISGSYNATQQQAEGGHKADIIITDWNENGLNSASTQIKNNINEEVTFDNNGILARTWDEDYKEYSNEQLRITHNLLCFTDDGWETVRTAIGKQEYSYYINPSRSIESFKNEHFYKEIDTGYGVTAKFVNAGYVNGSQIVGGQIFSTNYEVGVKGTRIDLDKGQMGFFGGESYLIFSEGELEISGKIRATSLTLSEGVSIAASKVDLSNYYTKSQIDNKGFLTNTSLTEYAKKEDINNMITSKTSDKIQLKYNTTTSKLEVWVNNTKLGNVSFETEEG